MYDKDGILKFIRMLHIIDKKDFNFFLFSQVFNASAFTIIDNSSLFILLLFFLADNYYFSFKRFKLDCIIKDLCR